METKTLSIEITFNEALFNDPDDKRLGDDHELCAIRVLSQSVLLDTGRKLVEMGLNRNTVIRVMQEQGLPYPLLRQIDQHPKGPDTP